MTPEQSTSPDLTSSMTLDAAADTSIIDSESEPLVEALKQHTDAADPDEIDENVSEAVRYAKLFEIQHWRDSTGRYLDNTTFGFSPEQPPLTQEQFRDLPSMVYHAVVGAMAGGLAGEHIAFECSAALCSYAPDMNSRLFLATQVIDEARHVEVFTHRLEMLGKKDIETTLHKYVNPRMFKFHDAMREKVCMSRDFIGGIIGQNIALEGLALGFFEFNAGLLKEVDPGSARVLETVVLDERRHVGFGLIRLRQVLDEAPETRAFVEDTVGEMSDEMMSIFEENADSMSNSGLDPTEAMDRVRTYHAQHLRRLGLSSDSVVHPA